MLLLLCLSSDRDQMSFFSSYMGVFAFFDAMRIHSAYCKAHCCEYHNQESNATGLKDKSDL